MEYNSSYCTSQKNVNEYYDYHVSLSQIHNLYINCFLNISIVWLDCFSSIPKIDDIVQYEALS